MLIVRKYGGTSVGDADRIRHVARKLAAAWREGNELVVVLSAMGKTTDELIAKAKEIAPDAFANSEVRFIYGHANTLAETYAAANGFIFVPIQDD